MKYWLGVFVLISITACKVDSDESPNNSSESAEQIASEQKPEMTHGDRMAKRLKDSLAIVQEAEEMGYPATAEKITARLDALEARDNKVIDLKTANLPAPCTLIDDVELGSIIGINNTLINRNSGNRANRNKYTTSCFYKWNDPKKGPGMVMIQMQKNPMPEEIENWPKLVVDNKKTKGERTMDNQEVQVIYEDWNEVGDDGAYSKELHKYYFRYKDIFLFTIAFNDIPEKEYKKYVKEIGDLILKKF